MHPSVLLLFKVEPLFVPSYLCDFGALCLRYNRLAMNAKNIDSVKYKDTFKLDGNQYIS